MRHKKTGAGNSPSAERPKVHAYVIDSTGTQVAKLDSPAFLDARYEAANWQRAMKASASASGSAQIKAEIGTTVGGVDVAVRPFDLSLFAYASVCNTYHSAALAAKVKDIVGRPWRIDGDGSEAQRARLETFFRRAFGRLGFAGGMGCIITDYEALGNGYLEVVPALNGEPSEFAHVPSAEIWVRLDGLGYVQQKHGKHVHFRDYLLDPKIYDALSDNDPLKREWKGTSLVHFQRYSPWSPHYGIPSIMPAWSALTLWVLVAEYNLQFFNNNAIPEYAVILEGETSEDTVEVIKGYFKHHLKGQSHKTLVLDTPQGAKIRFEKLTSDSAREGSFRLLRQDCRDEILHAHGVPPQKVGIVETGKLGGNLATEQMREYKESIVKPGREMVTAALYEITVRGFGIEDLWLEFEEFDAEDKEANARVDQAYLDRSVLTPNEVRSKRFPELPPLEGGDEPLAGRATDADPNIATALADMQADVRKAVQR